MTRAVAYCRFSPRPHADECDSIQAQIRDITLYCQQQGYRLDPTDIFSDEAMSGSDEDRPGIWDAIASLKRGDVLVVRNVNRLARDTLLALQLEQEIANAQATLVSIEDGGPIKRDPGSDLLREILHALSKYQRRLGNARTKAAMLRHQGNGRRMSDRVPYGWREDTTGPTTRQGRPAMMVADPQEQAVITRILAERDQGASLRQIAKGLQAEGFPTRTGKRWSHVVIGAILRRATSSV